MLNLITHDNAIREIQLARPPVNALNLELLQALHKAIDDSVREGVRGIVLSGANADGAAGLGHIRSRGGLGWAQAPETASAAAMPAAAIAGGVDAVLSPAEMGRTLAEWSAP